MVTIWSRLGKNCNNTCRVLIDEYGVYELKMSDII
jgi:hypothetical protein